MGINLTWDIVSEIAVVVKNAVKVEKGRPGIAFRLCDWGAALNVADKFGHAFDLEISDVSGFASPSIFDPETEEMVEFKAPAVGEWIKVTGARVSQEVDSYGKRKIRIGSGWQIRRIGAVAGRLNPSKPPMRPAASRKRNAT